MEKLFFDLDITEPKDGLIVMKNRWWACIEGDPKKALFFGQGKSPQCNSQQSIIERSIQKGLYKGFVVRSVFVETAFAPERL